MEPGLVYVMLRFYSLTRIRDVLQCVVTWNEMHVLEVTRPAIMSGV